MGEFSVTWGSNEADAVSSSSKHRRFCYCGEQLVLLTSKTKVNTGRRFLRCRNYKLESCCGYFEWVDEPIDDQDKEVIMEQKLVIRSLEATVKTLKTLLLVSWVLLLVAWYRV